MKNKLLMIMVISCGLLAGCKKEYITNVTNYYQLPKDSAVLITSPGDSTLVHDTLLIGFWVNKKLNIIRTETHVDFNLLKGYDTVPAAIYFYANNYPKGSTHNFYLSVIAKDGSIYNSNIITLIISQLTKPAPNITFISKNSLKLAWTDNSNEELGYHVYRKEGNNDSVLIADLPKNSISYTDNSIDTLKSYTYRVEVYSSREKFISDPLQVQFITTKYMPYKSFTVDQAVDGEIAFTPDALKAVITNYDHDNFTIVNIADGSKSFLNFAGGSLGLAMSHNGSFFATGGSAGNPAPVKLWDLNSLSQIRQINPPYASFPWALTLNKTDELLLSGGKPIVIFNVSDGAVVKNFNNGSSFTRCIVYSSDESMILSGGNDNLVQLWNTASGGLIQTYTGHTGHVGSVCFNLDESKIFSGSYEDATIKIWDKSSGQVLKSISRNSGVVSIRLRPDGNVIAASRDGAILIMTQDGETIQDFSNHLSQFYMDYSSSRDMIASYGSGFIQLYLKTGHWEKI